MPRPNAVIEALGRALAASNKLTYLGLSFSCDFHTNMGQIFISASAGALHVSVASMVAITASAHGSSPSAVTTCRIDIGRALEESPKDTWQLLRLIAVSVSPPAFTTRCVQAAAIIAMVNKWHRVAGMIDVGMEGGGGGVGSSFSAVYSSAGMVFKASARFAF